MHDIILLIAVIGYMIAGYRIAGKTGSFIEEKKDYQKYDIDDEELKMIFSDETVL